MPYDITDPCRRPPLTAGGTGEAHHRRRRGRGRFDDQCIVLRTGAGVLVVSERACTSAS